MRKTLLLTTAILFCASLVLAQAGGIGVFADVDARICNLAETQYINVFLVHVHSPGATQSKFKVVQTDGANMTYFGDTVNPAYSGVGNTQTGITITYDACTASPNWIASAHYFGNASAECSKVLVVPHPDETDVLVWDCAGTPNQQVAFGGEMRVNANAWCNCHVQTGVADQRPPSPVTIRALSPNPASRLVTVEFTTPGAGDVAVEVFDVAGRKVLERVTRTSGDGVNVEWLDTSAFASGMYFLRITSPLGSATRRFAVVR